MNDMQELVTVEQAERAITALTYALPAAGVVLGALIGALRKRIGRGLLTGLVCGLSGPAIWLLWRMYNAIVGIYGLDSVRGLLVNLALFVAIGLVIGLAIGAGRRLLSASVKTQ
ncbi:MAG: hypothetical protein ACE149_07925 [Armatimonadota bacterium]